MTPEYAIAGLKKTLEDDTTLKGYVKQVLLGVRDRITLFPTIMIEPMSITENDSDINGLCDVFMQVAVIGYLQDENPERQIVGDSTHKGIMDFLNDIKKAISLKPTLGGKVGDTKMSEAHFEFVNYPIRSVTVGVELFLRQGLKSRL